MHLEQHQFYLAAFGVRRIPEKHDAHDRRKAGFIDNNGDL
jgi:hypothetical protein